MFIAAYLVNWTPQSALTMGTLYEALHGKEATLQYLGTIGFRVLVHIATLTKKTGGQVLGAGSLGTARTPTKAYRI